jgi:Ni,Fe-hydrogenase maturation factor
MKAPVVVFIVGNPSRGDDAIGTELLGRLAVWLDQEGLAGQADSAGCSARRRPALW